MRLLGRENISLVRKAIESTPTLWKWLNYQRSLRNDDRNACLVTLPQSGTHWIQNLLAKSFIEYYDLDYEIDSPDLKSNRPILRSNYEGEVEKDLPQVPRYHFGYFFLFRNKRVILLIRDLRDAVVSEYDKFQEDHDLSFSDFLRCNSKQVNEDAHSLMYRIRFLNGWGANKDKSKQFLVVKYEDLAANTQKQLEKVLSFVGIDDVSQEFLEEVVDFCSLENMKELEKEDKEKPQVINKGKVGRYKKYFSEEDLDYFNQMTEEHLEYDFGYNYE